MKIVLLLVSSWSLLLLWVLSSDEVNADSPSSCGPYLSLNLQQCKKRIKACKKVGIKIKWTGMGTVVNGKVQGDGGCQCDNIADFLLDGHATTTLNASGKMVLATISNLD